jgi:hypothetical protein
MPVPLQSQIGGEQQMIKAISDSIAAGLRVALPGIIHSFNPNTMTCVVQPAIKGQINGASTILKPLVDVPVIFPRGGGVTLTFPVAAGDECLVIFADRCIDFWWQSGGVQEPVSGRMHHLADAFAIVGPQSQAKKISGISTTTAQFRSDDGLAYLEINPTTHAMNIVAPGGLNVTTPTATFSAAVTVNGLFTFLGGMVGSAVSGVATKITGAINFIGSLTSNGKDISNTHTHNEVESGNDSTGEVN